MSTTSLRYGIPDLEFGCAPGKTINPSSFIGHELVALFCPLEPSAAARETAAYRHHCAEFAQRDAWLLTFADSCADVAVDGESRLVTIADPDRHGWVAFRDLTDHPEEMDRSSGATFLFTRGGGLHRYWHGTGHVDEVLAELRTPSSEHPHQLAG